MDVCSNRPPWKQKETRQVLNNTPILVVGGGGGSHGTDLYEDPGFLSASRHSSEKNKHREMQILGVWYTTLAEVSRRSVQTSPPTVQDRYERNLSPCRRCNWNVNSLIHDKYFMKPERQMHRDHIWISCQRCRGTYSTLFWSEILLCLNSEISLLQCNQTYTSCIYYAVLCRPIHIRRKCGTIILLCMTWCLLKYMSISRDQNAEQNSNIRIGNKSSEMVKQNTWKQP